MKWLNTIVCECGKNIDGSMTKPGWLNPSEVGISSNPKNPPKLQRATCTCGKEYIVQLRQGNTFPIINIGIETVEEIPFVEDDIEIDLHQLDRKELLNLDIEGRFATMKTEDLIQNIDAKLSTQN